jgi:DNA-directed RNA polymerase specialized sigma24 family protein
MPRLRAYVHRLVGDRETENEILQEISLRALAGEGPSDRDRFLAWSCGIGRHVIGIEWRRRRRMRAELPIEGAVEDEMCDPAVSSERSLDARASLRRAINDIDAEGLDLLIRRYILGKAGKDLAQELALTPAALRMRLMRLRSALRARRDDSEKS